MHLRILGCLVVLVVSVADGQAYESTLPQVRGVEGTLSGASHVHQFVVMGQFAGGRIEQVPEEAGNLISLSKLSAATRVLQTPISPQDLTVRYGSPIKGEGLIIGNGADVLYVAPGSGSGFGYIPYSYGN
ncbi:hypothetical protein [Pseudovibrio sp. Tun.PSC04-5.I4]|uniref:hypothetical protein n=1 Tax=Pseudovibrio sp. Tun.PSC04-5.I4 TaxID=1798213 RepID=UPI000889B72F|nr:hypothetical protein [Pseudovibrio sp. Tun.PSC04-5.I4]SDR35268.1 hypothetical protein SAMN04515695_4838 [Pseudovibrio sp. Tun.PSC04-5.I4]